MICEPCRNAADADQKAAEIFLAVGHPPEICQDAAIQPHGCPCQHKPVGSATEET
jgi:hypothetical protein